MRFSALLSPTLKEIPKEAEVVSHQLMLRAGMIRKVAAGIYTLLPLGVRVIRKFEQIVREEMNRIGGQEILMPSMIPAELWQESGRWDQYGKELLRIQDRAGREFCYGPTHEEVVTDVVRHSVRSYRELPVTLYQIQTKFRDEIRPRFGLMRGREFGMKDAYSFHADMASLDHVYDKMRGAYLRIFKRAGLDARVVEADSGAIGGDRSAEFMVMAQTGEDLIADCPSCGYAANVEAAPCGWPEPPRIQIDAYPALETVATPGQTSIEAVCRFLQVEPVQSIKTLLYVADGQPVMVLLRGDRQLNELKLKKVVKCAELEKAPEAVIGAVTGAPAGFLGPIGLKSACRVIGDLSVRTAPDAVIGANQADTHYRHAVLGREYRIAEFEDVSCVQEGDWYRGPLGEGPYQFARGIEVGHIFKLGDKYSEAMNATFLDSNGKPVYYEMGCYGIGIGRTVAAAIEQFHDEKGMQWPPALAPFLVDIMILNMKDEGLVQAGNAIYDALNAQGLDVLLDDREVSAGVKFNDAELIGFPVQVVIGKQQKQDGRVEVRCRRTGKTQLAGPDQLAAVIADWTHG